MAGAALVVGYEWLAHWMTSTGRLPWLGGALSAAPLAILALWVLWSRRSPLDWAVLGGASLLVLAADRWVSSGALHALPHVAVCLFVASLFGRTLLPGRETLVTRLALHVHGSLPDFIHAYTLQVTWAWFLFMSALALVSLGMSCFAVLSAWSLLANVLTLPLVLLMFIAEYAYRRWRFPGFEHASLTAAMRAFRDLGVRDARL
jgi:uncharacterized membrane protein